MIVTFVISKGSITMFFCHEVTSLKFQHPSSHSHCDSILKEIGTNEYMKCIQLAIIPLLIKSFDWNLNEMKTTNYCCLLEPAHHWIVLRDIFAWFGYDKIAWNFNWLNKKKELLYSTLHENSMASCS